MVTLIGTPPNIIVAGIRQDSLGESFGMFDFAPVGGVVAAAGILFVALLGWRLIPSRDATGEQGFDAETASYVAELVVPEGNAHVGARVSTLGEAADEAGVSVMGLVRDGRRLYGSARAEELRAGDALVLEGLPEALDEFRAAEGLQFSDDRRMTLLEAAEQGLQLVEVVVTADSRINGKSAQAVGLAWRQRTVLLGISRRGRRVTDRLRRTRVQTGDLLLLLAPKETSDDVVKWLGALPLADRGLAVTDKRKVWPAVGLFAGAVAAASLGIVDLTVALGVVVAVYAASKVLPLSEIYEHVEWPVVVLLGSMIPLGGALQTTGGTELIAGWLTAATDGQPAWVALLVLMLVTMTLSDVLNNAATAIVAAPIGISVAQALGVNPDTFLMAVAVAASCAFLTPIGHKNNTLVLGPGGYSFGDYWWMGLPLQVLVVAVAMPALLFFWPL
jgi:di/tricarboxylate transporter